MAAVVAVLLGVMALSGAEGGGGGVPLVAWSTARGLWSGPSAPPLPAVGHLVEDHQLGALLEPALTRGPPTLLLVLHDELSVEDFTAYGGSHGDSAFPRLQAALSAAGSVLQLWSVPGGAVGLPHTYGAEALLGDDAVGQLRANNGSGGAMLLRLPRREHGSHLMSQREILASNDEALGEVLSALQDEGLPYTAVLTALRPSRVPPPKPPPSIGEIMGGGRSLLQAPSTDHRMNGGGGRGGGAAAPPPPLQWPPPPSPPQLLLWAESIHVEHMGGGGAKKWDLTPRTFGVGADVDLGGSTWDPQEAKLVLRYGDVAGAPLTITLTLRQRWFPVSCRRWFWLAEIDISGGGKGGTSSSLSTNHSRYLSRGGGAGAPLGWSWRCDQLDAPGDYLRSSDQSGAWRIYIKGIQVQPFNVSWSRFGPGSDCSSFVSLGAASALLLLLLLVPVSVHVVALLLRLQPMDRFDDPRGPALHVANGD